MINSKRKFVHDLSEMEIMDLFLKEMELNGLIFENTDLPIRMDGRTRYVRVSGRSRRKTHNRSGWYIGHLGEYPVGKFGWMHGSNATYTWSLFEHVKNHNGGKVQFITLTPEDIEKQRLDLERQKKIRLIEEKEKYSFSRALAILEYYRSHPLTSHPYIQRKNISPSECSNEVRIYNKNPFTKQEARNILTEHFPEYSTEGKINKLLTYQSEEIKYRGFNLLILGRDINHQIIMFQLIFDKKSKKTDKDKHFPKNLIKQDTFHIIGPSISPSSELVIICEGWATGISLHRFTLGRVPIVVAWDSGNMNSVAKVIRKHAINCKIYSANDNDHTSPLIKNAGINGGLKTCEAVGAYMTPPKFDSLDEKQADWSDWNDIDLNYDFNVAQAMFIDAFKKAKLIHGAYVENIELLSNRNHFSDFAYTDFNHFSHNPMQFNKFWLTMVNLISTGIMHCDYSKEEQIALYENEKSIVDEKFKNHNESFFSRNYDSIIDKKISLIFFEFVNELAFSTKHMLFNDELFIPTIKQLAELQHYTNSNLLYILKEQISEQKDEELAEAIFFMYLKKSKIFRDDDDWKSDLTKLLKQTFKGNIQEGLFYSIMAQQKSEYHYWEYTSRKDREQISVNDFIRIYENEVNNYVYLSGVCMSIHYGKLPYMYTAVNSVLLGKNKESDVFLDRLIHRLQQTNGFNFDKNSFIEK